MSEQVIVIIVSILLLAGLALIFIYFLFKSFRAEVDEYYQLLLQKMGVRLDKIPNLIETVRAHLSGHTELLVNLVTVRAETWPVSKVKDRVHAELEISELIHKVWALTGESHELERDTNFLALKMEFKEISHEIEEMSEYYNGKVRNYNKIAGFILLAPILRLMRFGKMHIFEFEK